MKIDDILYNEEDKDDDKFAQREKEWDLMMQRHIKFNQRMNRIMWTCWFIGAAIVSYIVICT